MQPKIIYEDKELLVLDKPAGMVVNRAQSVRGETVQDFLEDYLRLSDRGIGDRAGIVHRLDKETSGLLLVAKTQAAFQNLQKQFKERRVEKRYHGLVHGLIASQKGEITAPISRSPYDRKKFGVFLGGRGAKTGYEVLRNYRSASGEEFSLVVFSPETGRTHQIRVHTKYLGHPLVADPLYAGKRARADRAWCPRLFLHAARIAFVHPASGEKIKFSLNLPSDLEKSLKTLNETG